MRNHLILQRYSRRSEIWGLCPRGDCTKKPMRPDHRVRAGRRSRCAVTGTEQVIRWSTAGAVVGVAAVAAAASYEHAYELVPAHGEAGWTARLVPLTVDGLIYASSMVMLDAARRKTPVPALARWLLGLGIAATLAANVAHGLGHGLIGAAVSAWPAVALVGSYELLMMVIRGAQSAPQAMSATTGMPDPLCADAVQAFSDELAADRVPSIRAIRLRLHVGQPRAQHLQDYLIARTQGRPGSSHVRSLGARGPRSEGRRRHNRTGGRAGGRVRCSADVSSLTSVRTDGCCSSLKTEAQDGPCPNKDPRIGTQRLANEQLHLCHTP